MYLTCILFIYVHDKTHLLAWYIVLMTSHLSPPDLEARAGDVWPEMVTTRPAVAKSEH